MTRHLYPHTGYGDLNVRGGQGIRESYSMDLVSASKVEKVIWMDGDSDYAKV